MAHTGGYDDHIPLLELVALGSHQVFHILAAGAKQNLPEGMGVEAEGLAGIGDVPVRVHIGGRHLNLLVEAADVETAALHVFHQPGVFFSCGGRGKLGSNLPQNGKLQRRIPPELEVCSYFINKMSEMQCIFIFLQFTLQKDMV
jgi:hypothetical protein